MHTLLVLRADRLAGCADGSDDAAELEMITDAAEAYEAKRWPEGKLDGGKGKLMRSVGKRCPSRAPLL